MTYRFHPEARAELAAAADYYAAIEEALALQFLDEVYAAVARVVDHPHAWSPATGTARRCLVNRFPFGVVYRPGSEHVLIVAVAHLHRRPDYWRKRLTDAAPLAE